MFKASSIVSGKGQPPVSGKKKANKPAMLATEPMITNGAGGQYTDKAPVIKIEVLCIWHVK